MGLWGNINGSKFIVYCDVQEECDNLGYITFRRRDGYTCQVKSKEQAKNKALAKKAAAEKAAKEKAAKEKAAKEKAAKEKAAKEKDYKLAKAAKEIKEIADNLAKKLAKAAGKDAKKAAEKAAKKAAEKAAKKAAEKAAKEKAAKEKAAKEKEANLKDCKCINDGKKHNWTKNGLKMTNHGVTLSTVEYGVIIQKSIINIDEDEVKDHAKNNESKGKKSEIGKFVK